VVDDIERGGQTSLLDVGAGQRRNRAGAFVIDGAFDARSDDFDAF